MAYSQKFPPHSSKATIKRSEFPEHLLLLWRKPPERIPSLLWLRASKANLDSCWSLEINRWRHWESRICNRTHSILYLQLFFFFRWPCNSLGNGFMRGNILILHLQSNNHLLAHGQNRNWVPSKLTLMQQCFTISTTMGQIFVSEMIKVSLVKARTTFMSSLPQPREA